MLPTRLLLSILLASILAGITPVPAQAQSPSEDNGETHCRRLWIASMISVAVASGMDAETSWGKHETNGLLASSNGSFGVRGVSIKAGLMGATLVPQILLRHHATWQHRAMIANFAEAGVFTATSVHNIGVH